MTPNAARMAAEAKHARPTATPTPTKMRSTAQMKSTASKSPGAKPSANMPVAAEALVTNASIRVKVSAANFINVKRRQHVRRPVFIIYNSVHLMQAGNCEVLKNSAAA